MNQDKQEFCVIISENFDEIRNNFKSGLNNHGYEYNEDLLADTFIKCNSTLKDKKLTKKEAIKYFWVAYINKLRTHYKNYIKTSELNNKYDLIDDQYNESLDILYKYIINFISNNFDKKIADAWIEYTCNGLTYQEVVKKYKLDKNFQYYIKKIRALLRSDLNKNKYFKELLENTRTT